MSLDEKVLNVCEILRTLPQVLTPKQFVTQFLQSNNSDIAYLRRYWAQPRGIESSMELARSLRNELARTETGREAWQLFIKEEASRILAAQSPPRGNYPEGRFHSSTTVVEKFFTSEVMTIHDQDLSQRDMPFLYSILYQLVLRAVPSNSVEGEEVSCEEEGRPNSEEEEAEMMMGISYECQKDPVARAHHRAQRIALTICQMVAFALNRRHNAFQLINAVRLYACGASDRLHEYLHYLGLAASRKTAISALKSLALENARKIQRVMRIHEGLALAPTLCIDNIDMEQRVHQKSVGKRNTMFRGTWGYLHLPDKAFIASLDSSELNLDTLKDAISKIESTDIEPRMFLPTLQEEALEIAVWKSQIARVLHDYIAIPMDPKSAIPLDPPVMEQVSHTAPDLVMLKLIEASDNSAEGIGQVFQCLINQSGLSVEELFSRLQPMDGDLGTVQNFNCLRQQRAPSSLPQHRLENIFFQLGASHTLWNIGSNIFSHHFGNPHDASNCGAWQHLEALGFPSEKAIQKKDFTLMINQMERVFEANIYYCLRVIMDIQWQKPGGEKIAIPTNRWNSIINECYEQFCTPAARTLAARKDCARLSNTLLLLHDFSSVVEAQRSMKAGDVGRLMSVWKKWSLMTQALTGLTNYSSYLPKMVLMLTVFLPASLSKYFRHNLLISPSGRPNHFVAKDFELEKDNYWLKFLFNSAGMGTQIDQLRDLFSPNIFLLQRMFQSLKLDCGAKLVHQSHKNKLPQQSLVMFAGMGTTQDILAQNPKKANKDTVKVTNTYLLGIKKIRTTIRTTDPELKKFKKHLIIQTDFSNNTQRDCSDDEAPQSDDF
ncbi:hypothetical protein MJO28_008064 [Puccinia striiformis f. sp. tritici]|uniref:Uncharacterized protein n=1 Tax=Puccinia striiformis f. sp. tritici TaxID=168172 RepID=A0ACC0EA00_9BASI|nr:hypothetical protein MJO28_008064 [Puccinia striiformis f. sp. tritici]